MSYREPAYVIFDGDEDAWAYRFMRGWKANENIDFDFRDAHDLDNMTSRAQSEDYVKRQLRERMRQSKCAIVLIGEKTKNLYRFVRWELDLAQELGLPIIAINLNGKRSQDSDLCPPIIRNKCVVHIPFRMKMIQHTLDTWPQRFRNMSANERATGPWSYPTKIYEQLGIED